MSAGDLRPVHAAALRVARIVQHAGGELQFGVGQRVRRGRSGEIRHRIVGRVEAVGRGILQPRDHALGRSSVSCRPVVNTRRIFAGRVELLDRAALVLAVESAQRLAGELFAQFVGDRLIGGRHVARGLDRLGGRRCSRVRAQAPARRCAVSLRRCCRSVFGSAAGAVTTSAGFGLSAARGFTVVVGVGRVRPLRAAFGWRSGTVAVVSVLKSAGGRRRDVGGFGARDRGLDRELCGAGARRGSDGGARTEVARDREERCRDGHQDAVKSRYGHSNSHASSHPLGRNCPGIGTVRKSFATACAKAPASISTSVRLHATRSTQTIHAPLSCSQLPRGATHDKLTSNDPFVFGLRAILPRGSHLSVTSKPRFKGSGAGLQIVASAAATTSDRLNSSRSRRRPGSLAGGFVELAVERRAADLQPPRHLRHLSAIMRDREADDFVLHLLQRPHFAGAGQHRQHACAGQRRDRYFIT